MMRSLSVALLISLLMWSGSASAVEAKLKIWVVEASTENRETKQIDSELDDIAAALKSLPQDTYKKISAGVHELAATKPTRVPLFSSYALEASSPEPTSDGRFRTDLRILMKTRDTPPKELEALSTELLLRPEKHVVVRGLKKEKGKELLLVLALTVPKKESP